jgi:hypothetical protein
MINLQVPLKAFKDGRKKYKKILDYFPIILNYFNHKIIGILNK